MNFDPQVTLKWATGVLTDPEATATAYCETSAPAMDSFINITLPVYVAAFFVGLVLSWITGSMFMFPGIAGFLFSLIWALAWTWVIAFLFDFFAGTFDGERNFDAAYAVVALAIVPAAIGNALGPLPWIGWLISIGGGVYSIVLAYRFLPSFLSLPDASRVKHIIASILSALVINFVVLSVLGSMFVSSVVLDSISESSEVPFDTESGEATGSGIFSGLERQAGIAEAAGADTYTPPGDGKLTDAQVATYVDVLEKTRALTDRLGSRLENMDQREDPSISDVFSGIGGAMRIGTAEMEVVKTGGGNWAEHQWVRGQIETARIQQDLNDTTSHNYGLFQKYQSEIEQYE